MAFHVYILTNYHRTVLYTGMTGNLTRRMEEHRLGLGSAFVEQYRYRNLVYAEEISSADDAAARERRIKRWRREWKVRLIESINPEWRDLSETL